MDAAILLGSIAIVVSVATMITSTLIGFKQARLARDANQIPAVIDLLTEFRTVKFHDNYMKIVTQLDRQNPTGAGISDLPEDMREAVLDVGYYFQVLASLIALGILDEASTMAMLHYRFVTIWDAIAPYVMVERSKPYSDGHNLSMLEFFAERARRIPVGATPQLLNRDATLRLAQRHLGRRA
ncbi:DUF4760 domain-containing protein [Nocardia vinacea]|uniref:DUF4760 domain-containing protein n=1 Tax=Nocardia vinacea TaxID=96468 RepID=UPI0002E47623|nr:hypothetical protein [Nocardia vinacea]